ncbi:MAG: acetyltransferase [Caulobacteraceae bacterium]|nr:acetyltransferase [Caulobacteraceae bacterium]
MIIETERLTLRPLVATDAAQIYPLMSDPDVMAHWDTREIDDPEVVQALVDERLADELAGRGHAWAVELTTDQAFLGFCELTEIDRRHRRAEIAFLIRREAWGQGYGREGAQALLGQAAALRLKRVIARTHVGDSRSERLLTDLGFEQEGYLRGHIDREGERRDCRLWGLLL